MLPKITYLVQATHQEIEAPMTMHGIEIDTSDLGVLL
jgi:hypothetical protein